MCVCTCSDLAPSIDPVLNGATSVAMIPSRLNSTLIHRKKARNKISIQNMKNKTKKKSSTTSPVRRFGKKTNAKSPTKITVRSPKQATQKGGRVVQKTKAKSLKKFTDEYPKKAKQNGKVSAEAKTGKSTNTRRSLQTPERQKIKTHSAPSTPSTVASNSSSSSKRAVSMMNSLDLESPPKKTKKLQDEASAIDFEDASEIDWLSKKGLCDALTYYGEDPLLLQHVDHNDMIVLLCTHFKPNDIRPVFQGIYQDAGKNWRNLKLVKHRLMKTLAIDFAKTCVDIGNARTALIVPGRITIKKENLGGTANA